jgi:hypothetical protein
MSDQLANKHHRLPRTALEALCFALAALSFTPALAAPGYARRVRAALSLGLNHAARHDHINDPTRRGVDYTPTLNKHIRFRLLERQRLYHPYTSTPVASQRKGERRTVEWRVVGGPMRGKSGTADVRIFYSQRRPADWGSHTMLAEKIRDRAGHTIYDHRSTLPMIRVDGHQVYTGGRIIENGVIYTTAIYTKQGTPLVLYDRGSRAAANTSLTPPRRGAGGFLKRLLTPPWKR